MSSLYLAEASIKIATTVALAVLTLHDEKRSLEYQYRIIRANGTGSWVSELRSICQRLHRIPNRESKAFARAYTQKLNISDTTSKYTETQALTETIIRDLGEPFYEGIGRSRVNLLDAMDDLVYIRNKTRGHGALTWIFYENQCHNLARLCGLIAATVAPTMNLYILHDLPTGQHNRYSVLNFSGLETQDDQMNFDILSADQGELLVLYQASALRLPPLIHVDPSTLRTYFANGNWRESSSQAQFINYDEGQTIDLHRPSLAVIPSKQPISHTAALRALEADEHALHNLPGEIDTYVSRAALESRLRSLLLDRTHRVISIRGPGGAGKTTLALRVAHSITQSGKPGFDAVIWLSGRDVDLLPTGPHPVQQDVSDLESIARSFAQLQDAPEESPESLEFLRDELDPEWNGTRYLIILDNVETLETPDSVHEFFDRHTILPSKFLTTTRHQSFMGDFPILIPGMESSEAHELISTEARHRHSEPAFDLRTRERIIQLTGSLPYALTLATAHVASGQDLSSIPQALSNEETLSALFDRSVERLDEDALFLYLLLGQIGKPVVGHIIDAILQVHDRNYASALNQLQFYSLCNNDVGSVGLTQMSYVHSRLHAIGHPDEITIRGLGENIHRWSSPRSGMSSLFSFFHNMLDDIRDASLSARKTLVEIVDRASRDYGELSLAVAREKHRLDYSPDEVRVAFQNAARASPSDPEVWIEWSRFEYSVGNYEQAISASIRAIDAGHHDPEFSSELSFQLASFLNRKKEDITPYRRGFLVASVRRDMESHRGSGLLGATALSRLAWLYLFEASSDTHDANIVRKANEIAQEGLVLEPNNVHCRKIIERTSTGF